MTIGTHECKVKKIFTGSEDAAPQQLTGGELFVNIFPAHERQPVWSEKTETGQQKLHLIILS